MGMEVEEKLFMMVNLMIKIFAMLILEKVYYLNTGSNINRIQNLITLKDTNWLDGKHVIFGKVFQEIEVIKEIFFFFKFGFLLLLLCSIFFLLFQKSFLISFLFFSFFINVK